MSEVVAGKNMVDLDEVVDLLRKIDDVLIVSHVRPDGDCLGSTMGLLHTLRAMGRRVAAYNVGPVGDKWNFVPGIEEVKDTLPEWTPQWTVFVDCGAVYRVSDEFKPIGQTINIDHHLTNSAFAEHNYIDSSACAVGEQIHRISLRLGVTISPEIASCLFLSILTDTGGFRYPNTTAKALRLAGDLVESGADPGMISQEVFESKYKGEIELTGKVFSDIRYEEDGVLSWAVLHWQDILDAGGADNEPDGLSSEIRAVRGVEISCLFIETEEGWCRAGFRGKGNINCGAIAESLGGGGHFNASGTMIRDVPFDQAMERVLTKIRTEIHNWRNGTA